MLRRGVVLALCLIGGSALAAEPVPVAAAMEAAVAAAEQQAAEGKAVAPGAATGQAVAGEAAAAPAVPASANPDPWEGFNRGVFRFNDTLDHYALKPVAKGYRKITPRAVRTGVTNFFHNLRMPVVMLNDLLQGKVKAAGQDLSRFVVNSTAGVAGLFDVSSHLSIPDHNEDFGQTLGVWGLHSGPYLVLPFLGPSSTRDGVGQGVDVFSDPLTYALDEKESLALFVAKGVNARSNLLDVEEIMQGDRYLFLRDLYLQSREFAVKDGRVESDPFLDEEEGGESSSDEPGASDGAGEAGGGEPGASTGSGTAGTDETAAAEGAGADVDAGAGAAAGSAEEGETAAAVAAGPSGNSSPADSAALDTATGIRAAK